MTRRYRIQVARPDVPWRTVWAVADRAVADRYVTAALAELSLAGVPRWPDVRLLDGSTVLCAYHDGAAVRERAE